MSVTELRLEIIQRLAAIEDEQILKEILNLVNFEKEIDSIYHLTDAERKGVDTGLKDIEEGRVYSSEDADLLMSKWLKK